MRERPILFSGPMVRAILNWHKAQTRRICKVYLPPWGERDDDGWPMRQDKFGDFHREVSPYGEPGDRLWVRETWGVMGSEMSTALVAYAARLPAGKTLADTDGGCNVITVPDEWRAKLDGLVNTERWRPSIHMPRWASRLTLEVTAVRVEPLQSLSEKDARAEGVQEGEHGPWIPGAGLADGYDSARDAYADLWESLNGPDSWSRNPFVWVVKFRAKGHEEGLVRQSKLGKKAVAHG